MTNFVSHPSRHPVTAFDRSMPSGQSRRALASKGPRVLADTGIRMRGSPTSLANPRGWFAPTVAPSNLARRISNAALAARCALILVPLVRVTRLAHRTHTNRSRVAHRSTMHRAGSAQQPSVLSQGAPRRRTRSLGNFGPARTVRLRLQRRESRAENTRVNNIAPW